mmetsp:Transcript_26841/g.52359  ORF Transcript_26841/g.52359 Transcript_26841/m.52359 type:complete len:81 (+) Transcript_26841:55-297(+)|eukprot:CAMPEP_0173378942 /NCGR_PEP_ID=MMETSP1356-20130122/2062_1 /TAXON_ID=77927 ORGANISM="Hemiselmis virescens, Strain PCC157" /NCGR_SAMPLE_ID=MMETSP1356 /ASSEMBLY_ACC=CAM_ASM_000847 /LENGTH=80 /DNA_ID=CAMNT_0014332197 /DNA_START=54 /DNA_END=296 /DNA_ORIENTATION=+
MGLVAEAQEDVIRALEELKAAVVNAKDSTEYLNTEVSSLDGKMRMLERSAGLVYTPFRASLYEYAAENKAAWASQNASTQ